MARSGELAMKKEMPHCLHSLVTVVCEASAVDLARVSSESPAELLNNAVSKTCARACRGLRAVGAEAYLHAEQRDALRDFGGIDDLVALMRLREVLDDDVFYLFLQKQKIGAELHIYLEEGKYHKRLFRGPSTPHTTPFFLKAGQSAAPCIFCHVRRCLSCSLHRAARPEYLRSCQQVGKARSMQRAVRPEAAGVQAAVARGGECFRMPWKARHARARTREFEAWESASKRVKKAANNLARCLPPPASESRIDNARLQEKLKSQEDGCARAEILAKLCISFCHTATAYQHEVCSRSSTHSIRMNIRMNACVRTFATLV